MTTAQPDADPVIDRLIAWAGERDAVRAMLLTSTRAVPGATVDVLSDHDVILVVRDIGPLVASGDWLNDIGDVLVACWNPVFTNGDHPYAVSGNVTQYRAEDRLHALAGRDADGDRRRAGAPGRTRRRLPRAARPGWTDGRTPPADLCGLRPGPSRRGGVPDRGQQLLHRRSLRREVPLAWRSPPDEVGARPRHEACLSAANAGVGVRCTEDWSKPTGSLGKGLRRRLPADIWREFEASYAGGGVAENQAALYRTIDVYRRVASHVADRLGYRYPDELDRDVTEYARQMLDSEGRMIVHPDRDGMTPAPTRAAATDRRQPAVGEQDGTSAGDGADRHEGARDVARGIAA